MRLAIALALGLSSLYGQTCAPSPTSHLPPTGSVEGLLDDASCRLSDGSAYEAYRLDLPVRGRIEMELPGPNADLILILRDETGARVDSGVALRRGIEAGSYTVLVNGSSPGQVGSFSVRTVFTPEPGMWCAEWGALGLNQTVAGTLGASGCRMPNGTQYEAYWLNTFGAGTLTVEVTSLDFTPELIVRSGDGAAVASGVSSRLVEVSADSRYQIVVHSSDTPGRYRIATSFQPADSDTCRPVTTLTEPASGVASVNAESCVSVMPGSGDVAYYNYYGLTVGEAGLAEITASSGEFAPVLNVLDESGNLIASDSEGGGAGISQIRVQLKPGRYTVRLFSPSPAGGAYQLSYGFAPGPPRPCQPVTASLEETLAGRFTPSSCGADFYGITLPSAGTLDVILTAPEFGGVLAVRDAKDDVIIMDADAQGLGTAHLAADLPAGSYMITAGAHSGSGPYQLKTSFTAHEIAPCGYIQALDLNGGYIQKLGPASCRDRNGQPADYYTFTLPSGSVVAAVMTSSDLNGYLTITDDSGNPLRSDDNSYGLGDSLIVQYLTAGTYRLEARAAAGTVGGYYQVDLRTIPGDRPRFCGARGTLALGGTVTGTIDFSGCAYVDSTFANIYSFAVENEMAVDIRLESGAFDAFLILMDSFGNVLAQDDDGGGSTDARITDLVAPGTYYVIAKPFREYFSSGGYTLSLGAAQ